MNANQALLSLAESTAEAVQTVLASLAPDAVEAGAVSVVPSGVSPLQAIPAPSVAASVSYVDGVTGGNVFVITRLGARRLAAAMMGQEPPAEDHDGELSELELSAVGEAMNQSMAAAAGATGRVLGQEVEISVPETKFFANASEADGLYPESPHATTASFRLLGEQCRLVQLIPNAFVVRMTRALTDRVAEEHIDERENAAPLIPSEEIRALAVRVSAELGRATLPIGRAVGLAKGAVVELNRGADDPIDLFVNGRRFATARLMLIDETEWAVRIEQVLDPAAAVPQQFHQGGN